MKKKYVYLFSEGNANMRELLGGKGANLAEMTGLGMPVPQGFTVTTEACTKYYEDGKRLSGDIVAEIYEYLGKLEEMTGKKFGDIDNPLLVSVRSGARASMPGMMDTILNLGLNDAVTESFAKRTGNPRFAYDSYRRFIQMYSDVVMGIGKKQFEEIIDEMKAGKGVTLDVELDADDLKKLAERFKAEYRTNIGRDFPSDPREQLLGAINAVFNSWDNPRAIYYRRMNDIPSAWGTAVNIQMMVFGNTGDRSGTGVAFTRNPATGEKKLFGEFLMNAQGEDVVAGVRTPHGIDELREIMPSAYNQFAEISDKLEKHYRDMQDMEFTIEDGKLYMLQTRNGKRTAAAALKIACDLVDEGMITKEDAVMMVEPKQLDALLHPRFDPAELKKAAVIGHGLAASPGAGHGRIALNPESALKQAEQGHKVILVRQETSPEDIEGMHHSDGILTARGGMTSHAAVVARGMGVCCVAGCGTLKVDEKNRTVTIGGRVYNEGDCISLDGATGNIYDGKLPKREAEISGDFARLMGWADELRVLKVCANADTPHDAAVAIRFGAQGIGLCRTEHMFFDESRIPAMREMILAKSVQARRGALAKLLPMQREDFEGIYRVMGGNPVIIRFLDPPLHEFLPKTDEEIKDMSRRMGVSVSDIKDTIDGLHEFNPMMGHRGCRLTVTYPEIAEMQTRAVMEAAINVSRESGRTIKPEIMIPLVGEGREMQFVKNVVDDTARAVMEEKGMELPYLVGAMIEIPRAALTADEVAEHAQFFSFGTNDLTQMTFGFSRDDAGKFLDSYYDKRIYEFDPFAKLDVNGVGQLVRMAVKLGRSARPDIQLGVCGEHGGDPSSVEFFNDVGLDYVSCSPFRVPIARLAAAHAAIKAKRRENNIFYLGKTAV